MSKGAYDPLYRCREAFVLLFLEFGCLPFIFMIYYAYVISSKFHSSFQRMTSIFRVSQSPSRLRPFQSQDWQWFCWTWI